MSKSTEIIHCRIERFSLSKEEIAAALRIKYGSDPAFDEGSMTAAHLETVLPSVEGYGDTTFEFTIDLTSPHH
ncbi:hypothetical protein [Pseudomonas capsici]|uniref:hypothetical protein n=1 Tax=Pseudomonas capsici TaxID=2810614 RepID=UPI0021F21FCF|nr:hypothetical protein [Pseudomonas capsici]MCV4285105.1 hypothetical protein [Pseudomonas capsici]